MFQISFAHTQPYWGDQEWHPHHQQAPNSLFQHLRNFHGFQKYIKKCFRVYFQNHPFVENNIVLASQLHLVHHVNRRCRWIEI